jgi:hypothetical protein
MEKSWSFIRIEKKGLEKRRQTGNKIRLIPAKISGSDRPESFR